MIRERLKANPEIFEKIKILNVENILTISPIDVTKLKAEAAIYFVNSKSDDLKKSIPGAYVENIEDAVKKLDDHIKRMIAYDSILYCIRLKPMNLPIGYVILNSPLSQNGLDNWSIDFWLYEKFRGKKIMASALNQIMHHMQQMDISDVFAMVEENNEACKNLITNLGFQYINEHTNTGMNIFLYGMKLS